MKQFDHERLDVYRVSIDFVVCANDFVEGLPRGRAYLANQLQRAATSVPLNIAEGTGEFSGAEKARFYRMAKRSATGAPRFSTSARGCDRVVSPCLRPVGNSCCGSSRC